MQLLFKKYRFVLGGLLLLTVASYYYFYVYKADSASTNAAYAVVDTVAKGPVSSGIQTTGKIIAEQKLDLNVYKRLNRIDVVNVSNGNHVEKGSVLMAFDKSASLVDVQSSRVAIADAQLTLQNEQANAGDPNTKVRTLENQIASYKKAISDAQSDLDTAYLDFLNDHIEILPTGSNYPTLVQITYPTLGGRYVGTKEGTYQIDVYASGASSGYSYRLSGLETGTESIVLGQTMPLGTKGLTISFPSTYHNVGSWIVSLPSKTSGTEVETKQEYDQTVADLNEKIKTAEVNLKNAQQDLADAIATDSTAYRDLGVDKASLAVREAQQKLSQNYDVLKDKNIVAPFSGTIQDMANVVVGATPTGGTSDSISLGTLISDSFLTTFTLSATDVAKVKVGQKVKVTATSFPQKPVFEGSITSISSLPSTTGVAQYEVLARLDYDATKATIALREGVLADVEVVEQEKSDVLRIPISALSYTEGKPSVKVVESLTDAQKAEVAKTGIIKMDGAGIISHAVSIELGIVGTYYAEVTHGLAEGSLIETTATAEASTSVVDQARFGPPQSSSNSTNRSSTRTKSSGGQTAP